jgi:hypothetical protein
MLRRIKEEPQMKTPNKSSTTIRANRRKAKHKAWRRRQRVRANG